MRKKILVILPIQRDKAALDFTVHSEEDIHFLEDPNFKYDAICTEFDVVAYTNRAIEYVQNNNIQGILYSHDMASLIAALVAEKTGLIGPSLDSVFLACHKYYSRGKEDSPVAFQALNLNDAIPSEINYPCYVKAPCLMCSHLHFIVNNPEEMKIVVNIMKSELPKWGGMFIDFFKNFISENKYPLAHQPVVLVEELVTDYSQCAVEGWVDNQGEIHIWAI